MTERVAEAPPLACGENVTVNDALCPAGITIGNAGPLMENSEVLGVSEEMVTLEPDAVSFNPSCSVAPTVTLPKLRLAGFIANWPTDVPFPESTTVKLETSALEVTTKLPLIVPVLCGANCTPKVKLCPGTSVNGKLNPLTLKPAPEAEAWVMITSDWPEFFNVSDCVPLLEVCTLPKLRLEGLGVSSPGPAAVPDKAMLKDGFEPLLVMTRLPVSVPVAVGANLTAKLVLCPGARVTGRLDPLILKPVPVTEACEIVALVPPVFVSVSERVWPVPVCIFPNTRLDELAVNDPAVLPIPESDRLVGLPFAIMATLPLALPLDWGLKVTFNVALCPAGIVMGVLRGSMANPAPVIVNWLIVRAAPPELVSVVASFLLLPTTTVPKDKLVGLAASAAGETAVPEREMLGTTFGAELVIESAPVAAPTVLGANATLKFALCPGARVMGVVTPFSANPFPVTAA